MSLIEIRNQEQWLKNGAGIPKVIVKSTQRSSQYEVVKNMHVGCFPASRQKSS